jgi:Ca2+-binding EF-hand superfamily protein
MRGLIAWAGMAALCGACDTGQNAGARNVAAPTSQDVAPAAASSPDPANTGQQRAMRIGGVAACQPTGEVNAMVSRWIELADADGNGQISKTEGRAFTNFVIGGFFFRADTDGSGVVEPEEGRAARSELVAQYPALATLLSQARAVTGESPFKALADMIGVDYGKPLTADDARQAARGAMDDLFKVVDDDSDGTITPAEARAASWEAVRALGQRAFRSGDENNDGKLDLAEFQAAVDATAKLAFEAGDANDNGSLTEQEAGVALGGVVRRLGIPMPPSGAAAR